MRRSQPVRLLTSLRSLAGPDPLRITLPFVLLSLSILVGGIMHAASLRWLSDDIFITFRYIDQWFTGNGLVYNPGEYVEGYTHPLWLLLLSVWRLLGLDMVSGSVLFGIFAQASTLLVLIYASWRLAGRAMMAIPAAAASVALHHDAAVWATSGLETALFTFLVTVSVVVFTHATLEERTRNLITGSLLTLATLTRPDGILFLVTMGGLVLARAWAKGSNRKVLRSQLMNFGAPALIGAPYALWKLSYYGNVFPNTYYAKSGGGAHVAQGFTYVRLFFEAYPSLLIVLVLMAIVLLTLRTSGGFKGWIAGMFSETHTMIISISVVMVLVYVLGFVVRVGGDFMYARFMIPVVPLMYLGGETAFRKLLSDKRPMLLAALCVLPLLVGTVDVVARERLFTETDEGDRILGDGRSGIVDEHYYWSRPLGDHGQGAIDVLRSVGEQLQTYFEGRHVRILIRGQACLGYYSKAAEVIENWGLTDAYIAHLNIGERNRIGHEKSAPFEYLVARRVHFFFFKSYVPLDTTDFRLASFDLPYGWGAVELQTYDRELMAGLKEDFPDQIQFVDFEGYLDRYLENVEERSLNEMQIDFMTFKSYYFDHNQDPRREEQFLEALRKKREDR